MTQLAGRPSIGAELAITLRLHDAALSILDAGAEAQSACTGRSPSRASWIRLLLDTVFQGIKPSDLISPLDLRERWTQEWLSQPTDHKVTCKLTEDHRILLRQWECAVQSLDWTRELYRNETVLILICGQGPILNSMLTRGINPTLQ